MYNLGVTEGLFRFGQVKKVFFLKKEAQTVGNIQTVLFILIYQAVDNTQHDIEEDNTNDNDESRFISRREKCSNG